MMSRTDRPTDQLFAIVRYDSGAPEPQLAFTVKEIVRSLAIAEAEVRRLNQLNSPEGSQYSFQTTRMLREDT
jgi:hypothetical protein